MNLVVDSQILDGVEKLIENVFSVFFFKCAVPNLEDFPSTQHLNHNIDTILGFVDGFHLHGVIAFSNSHHANFVHQSGLTSLRVVKCVFAVGFDSKVLLVGLSSDMVDLFKLEKKKGKSNTSNLTRG